MSWKFIIGTLTFLVSFMFESIGIGTSTSHLIWAIWGGALIIGDSIDEIEVKA